MLLLALQETLLIHSLLIHTLLIHALSCVLTTHLHRTLSSRSDASMLPLLPGDVTKVLSQPCNKDQH